MVIQYFFLIGAFMYSGYRLIFSRGAYPESIGTIFKLKHFFALSLIAFAAWQLLLGLVWQLKNLGRLTELYSESNPALDPSLAAVIDSVAGLLGIACLMFCYGAARRGKASLYALRWAIPGIAAYYITQVAFSLGAKGHSVLVSMATAVLVVGLPFGVTLGFYLKSKTFALLGAHPENRSDC
jgi:hypothetical protein